MMKRSRRKLIQQLGGWGMAAMLPFSSLSSNRKINFEEQIRINAVHYHFEIGDIKATIIGDGQALFPAYPLYAVNASKDEVEKTLIRYFLPEDLYRLQCNCLYLEIGDKKVLIDTGAGDSLGPDLGRLNLNLKRVRIEGAQITDVLLTHCHLDHIGGLMNNGEVSFPNAVIHLSQMEWDFWSKTEMDLSSMPIESDFRKNFKKAAIENLHPLKVRVRPFRFGEEVIPGIQAIDARGHSPGHTNYLIQSADTSLLHVGDVFHHPAFDLAHPDWATAFDQNAKQAYQTRRRILDMASEERTPIFSYHMPFPAMGYVYQKGNVYGWQMSPWIFEP